MEFPLSMMPRLALKQEWVQCPWHQRLRSLVIWVSWEGFLAGLFVFLASVIEVIVVVSEHSGVALYTGIGLLVALAVVAILLIRAQKRGSMRVREDVLNGLLRALHDDVFRGLADFRFTLFIRDPCLLRNEPPARTKTEEFLVPIIRRQSGKDDWESRVYYPLSSNAVTAYAWRQATSSIAALRRKDLAMYVYSFDDFAARREMVDYYVDKLHIEPKVVARIGKHMESVRQICSFPFVDDDGRAVALLSIDCAQRVFRSPEGRVNGRDFHFVMSKAETERFMNYLELMRVVVSKLRVR